MERFRLTDGTLIELPADYRKRTRENVWKLTRLHGLSFETAELLTRRALQQPHRISVDASADGIAWESLWEEESIKRGFESERA